VPSFPDKTRLPSDEEFARVLGRSAVHWRTFEREVSERHGPLTLEWKHYGARAGWTRKVLRGARNLCFVSARRGYFVVAFVMGDAAVAAAAQSALPREIVEALAGARRYAEGRGVRVEVRTRADVAHVTTLVALKIAH
jgi:hypothetical protein